MKIFEVLQHMPLMEGGDTDAKRIFSEIGTLAAWAGTGKTPDFRKDPKTWLDPSKLANSDQVINDVRANMAKAFKIDDAMTASGKEKTYSPADEYYRRAKANRDRILADMKANGFTIPSQVSWIGFGAGDKTASQSDVLFVGCPEAAGVSVKDDGGYGVANLGAKELNIHDSGDLFTSIAREEMLALKKAVMTNLLKHVQQVGQYNVSGEKYVMSWHPEVGKFQIKTAGQGPKAKVGEYIAGTPQQFLSPGFLETTGQWNRTLGRYYVENMKNYESERQAIVDKIGDKMKEAIEKEIVPDAVKLAKLGGFGSRPYYYQLKQGGSDFLAYVPDLKTADDLYGKIDVSNVQSSGKFDTGLDFTIHLKRPGASGTATVHAKARYDLGAFSRGASFKITGLKGKEHLYWREVK